MIFINWYVQKSRRNEWRTEVIIVKMFALFVVSIAAVLIGCGGGGGGGGIPSEKTPSPGEVFPVVVPQAIGISVGETKGVYLDGWQVISSASFNTSFAWSGECSVVHSACPSFVQYIGQEIGYGGRERAMFRGLSEGQGIIDLEVVPAVKWRGIIYPTWKVQVGIQVW